MKKEVTETITRLSDDLVMGNESDIGAILRAIKENSKNQVVKVENGVVTTGKKEDSYHRKTTKLADDIVASDKKKIK